MMGVIDSISSLSVPFVIGIVALIMLCGRRTGFGAFVSGAKEGLECAVGLLPSLVAILVGVKMLTASGFLEFVAELIEPFTNFIGVPAELVSLLLTRPFSGSGAMGAYTELMESYGADSFAAFCASVIMGSSDTIIYIIGLYFSSVGVKRSRYAFPCAFAVMLFCIFFSCFLSRLFFESA